MPGQHFLWCWRHLSLVNRIQSWGLKHMEREGQNYADSGGQRVQEKWQQRICSISVYTYTHSHTCTRSCMQLRAPCSRAQRCPAQTRCIPRESSPGIPTACPGNTIHSQLWVPPWTVKILSFHKQAAVIVSLQHHSWITMVEIWEPMCIAMPRLSGLGSLYSVPRAGISLG